MTIEPISLEQLVAAFALPKGELPRRVPKATLSDNVPTAADRRLIDGKLARLEWVAAINMANTGIPAGTAHGLNVDTINLLTARTRGPMPPRLAEIIHRAIPKPVILLHQDESGGRGAAVSLAPKRAAEREADRVVTTRLFDTGALSMADDPFLVELALPRLPTRDLASLYAGMVERTEALAAARAAHRPFRLPAGEVELNRWRDAMDVRGEVRDKITILSATLRKQHSLSSKVELGEKIRQAKLRLDEVQTLLK